MANPDLFSNIYFFVVFFLAEFVAMAKSSFKMEHPLGNSLLFCFIVTNLFIITKFK
jgi:hypothetical protein